MPVSSPVLLTTSSMSRTIASKSAVASGWKTIAALPEVCRLELHLELHVGRRHREQAVGGRLLELALAAQDVQEAHGLEATRCPAAAPRGAAARRSASPSAGASRTGRRCALPVPAGKMKNAFSSPAARRSRCGIRAMPPEIFISALDKRARAAGDQRRAAVGGELAVARERLHQEERDHVDGDRDQEQVRSKLGLSSSSDDAAAEEEAELDDVGRDRGEERRPAS